MTTRKCKFCGADISRLQWRRTSCNRTECIDKHEEELKEARRKYQVQYRAENPGIYSANKTTKERRCRICHHKIYGPNHWYCDHCLSRLSSAFNLVGDNIYAL